MAKKNTNGKRHRHTSSQTGRFLRLTGMTTSIATRMASHRLKRVFQSEEAAAESKEELVNQIGKEVADTLGQMKGAVMKVGQIASQMQDILPPQVAEALSVLQNASAPMPFSVIRRQIRKELGDEPTVIFKQFDDTPFAAASIGQVHRAVTHDDRHVVVKVQYPAVAESINSDMRHLRRILRLGGLLKVSAETLDALFDEIKNQLHEELDYRQEADNLQKFRDFHAKEKWIVIPEVLPELSSDKVLTLSDEPGDSLETVSTSNAYNEALRNQLGQRLFNFIGEQIFSLHAVHSDPHPGNFAFRTDGTLVVYDFGAIKRFPEDDVASLCRLLNAGMSYDYAEIDKELIELDVRKADGPTVEDSFYDGWLELLLPPFGEEIFDFGTSDLHTRLMKKTYQTPWSYLNSFQPSSKTLLLNRVLTGHYWTLKKLGVRAAFREDLLRNMHQFESAAPTSPPQNT